jgi:class 3 adenylate cyclase
MNDEVGQYRAELFDELVERLLGAMYPDAQINSKRVLRIPHRGAFRSLSIDFWARRPKGEVVVETKAPYTRATVEVIGNSVRRLKTVVELLSSRRISTFVLAIPTMFPEELRDSLEQIQYFAASHGATVTVWDEDGLRKLIREHLSTDILSFSLDELKRVLGVKATKSVLAPTAGSRQDVTVLVADFCSFTSFVKATYLQDEGTGKAERLIDYIMGRFYRGMRKEIEDHDGFLDKYMGDGILAYWFGEDIGEKFEACVLRLMGIAVNLAEEWDDEIDAAVEPKGLRAGAATGKIVFVEENPMNPPNPPIQAIGHPINIATRLQSKAKPNTLVIPHTLRNKFFGKRNDFQYLGIVEIKNLDSVKAWEKTFGTNGG